MIDSDRNFTTAARIASSIGERIINGALQPDAPLRQDHLAREFNSSHVPVREAFRQLEAQHLVVSTPRRGVRLLASLDGLQLANSRLVFAMARSAPWRPRSNQDHRLILQALRARNIDQACGLLARHIQTIERLAVPSA